MLSWPSVVGDTYLILYRPALNPDTPWVTLANGLPAAAGANITTFTHSGIVVMPMDSGSGGGGDVPPAPQIMSAAATGVAASNPNKKPHKQPTVDLPPVPWDPVELAKSLRISTDTTLLAAATQSASQPLGSMGFYQVFHVPSFPLTITNYVFDGPVFIPVDFKDYLERVENVELLLDGEVTDLAEFTWQSDNNQINWGTDVYFDRVANGIHQIQLRTTLRMQDDANGDPPILILSSLACSITVDNLVTFTNWDDLIWNNTTYTFRANLKNPNTDWSIDILDAWGNYVNGASGHTIDGQVEWTWDLTDIFSNVRDNLESDPFFDPYITFEQTASSGVTAAALVTRPTPIPVIAYPSVGRWIVAYLDTFYEPGTTAGDLYAQGMIGIAGGPALRGIPVSRIPLRFGTNSYTQTERDDSWVSLKGSMFMQDSRNLYFYGHGRAAGIGGDCHAYDANGTVIGGKILKSSKAFLTSKQVRDEITYNKHGGARPYRFVWLDGCSTANGDWPSAFGVNKATNSVSYYTNSLTNPSHKRPSAFVGWSQTIGGPGWGTVQNFMQCRTEWMFQWQQNWNTMSLVAALDTARSNSGWIPDGQFWGAIRVYGFTNLRMNQYNQKTDWPGP